MPKNEIIEIKPKLKLVEECRLNDSSWFFKADLIFFK